MMVQMGKCFQKRSGELERSRKNMDEYYSIKRKDTDFIINNYDD